MVSFKLSTISILFTLENFVIIQQCLGVTNILSNAAEPFPSCNHTPLPPPPTHPPPPPGGLSVQQPTYAILDGPSPSPPPPYSLDLQHRPPPLGNLPSPEYESIDGQERKAALIRQSATETSVDTAGYSRVGQTSNVIVTEDDNQ